MFTISRGVAGALLLGAAALMSSGPAAAGPRGPISLTAERMAQLRQVNSHVNSTIVEVSDMEQYGREDVWTLPTSGKGDCEDFALLKRKMLRERGWPARDLSIAVGVTAQGEPHAVLTVATDRGTYVLDNLTSAIIPASETGHTLLARQSGRGWVSASGDRTREPTVDLPVARELSLSRARGGGRKG